MRSSISRLFTLDTGIKSRRGGAAAANSLASSSRDAAMDAVEFSRSIKALCGGISFITDEPSYFYAIVVAMRSEQICIDRMGGLFHSTLIHPFFRVRVPKRSTKDVHRSTFKVAWIDKTHFTLSLSNTLV
ncbi:unnamed protein product [Protopolystoma xenopodis]|uniref:Uncharacterized protein n=1 Tax=Protopolystoma xenopodis TaxID=117903 RepID=A0A448XT78_9PLAT|nr:unnamed protein product [Protopolystoma xenopodis]